ncbi:MAG: hypothetical protein KF754_11285 [Planctomycetes bacterium]|nr:hypothetical protein [Planctomycetota bacterium]
MRGPTAILLLPLLALAQPAQACFFCEEGAFTTAMFAVTVFGLAFAGMAALCIAYWRAGAFKSSNHTEMRVLEVEGVIPQAEEKP